jgi:hypothetical protein
MNYLQQLRQQTKSGPAQLIEVAMNEHAQRFRQAAQELMYLNTADNLSSASRVQASSGSSKAADRTKILSEERQLQSESLSGLQAYMDWKVYLNVMGPQLAARAGITDKVGELAATKDVAGRSRLRVEVMSLQNALDDLRSCMDLDNVFFGHEPQGPQEGGTLAKPESELKIDPEPDPEPDPESVEEKIARENIKVVTITGVHDLVSSDDENIFD